MTSNTHPAPNTVYHIVLLAFEGSKRAEGVLEELKDQQSLDNYLILAQAVVERDMTGKIVVHEPGHGGIGGTLGATAGGLLGLFGGPMAVLVLAVAGGAAGGIAGHFAGRAIPVEDLKRIGDALPNNSSGLVMLLEDREAEKMINDLQGYQANIVTVTVGSELSGEISTAVAADIEKLDSPEPAKPAAVAPAATEARPDPEAPAPGSAPTASPSPPSTAPGDAAKPS